MAIEGKITISDFIQIIVNLVFVRILERYPTEQRYITPHRVSVKLRTRNERRMSKFDFDRRDIFTGALIDEALAI
jgi:hypothetical protein